jgi:hypothetical protein
MQATLMQTDVVDLYLDLLKRSLTGTLFDTEPDHDRGDERTFVVQFAMHYIRGQAITMLPVVRLENIRYCVEQVLRQNVPGDLIETGVWRGGACIFMHGCLKALGGTGRRVWVADSFAGLPEPDPTRAKERDFYHSDMMQIAYQRMEAGLDEVKGNFAAYNLLDDNVKFLQGLFKDTLNTPEISQLAVLRIDGDYYDSTMDALRALYHKVSYGGFVIIDDYGEDKWTDCRQAVDDFRRSLSIDDPMTGVDSKCRFWQKSLG